MADQKQPARGSSSPSTPGVGGAIKDAVAALSKAFAPRSVTQRKQKIDQAVDATTRDSDLGSQF